MRVAEIILCAAVLAWLGQYAWNHYVKAELAHILVSLEGLVERLDNCVADKEVQIADHLAEIATHNSHVNVKRADAERAKRVRDRLTELLQ